MRFLYLTILAWLFFGIANAQIIDPKETAKNKSEDRANNKIDQGIDKGLDKLEEGIGSLFKKKKKDKNQSETNSTEQNNQASEEPKDLQWAKFDFVAGNNVIFEDNLANEENGEFPSRWDLVEGRAENAMYDEKNVIYLMSPDSKIIPYIKNPDADYLPDVFTVEFDAWFEKDEYSHYYIWFYDEKNQEHLELEPVDIHANMVSLNLNNNFRGYYPGTNEGHSDEALWRHVSLAFNKRSLKVYLDDARVLNIPNLGINPQGITIGADAFNVAGASGINRFVANIRVAEGGIKLYEKYLQNGKIVASGIRFDVNKATLKPESMGVINSIKKIMTDHQEIIFSVEGHTDSDGDEGFNQQLSEQRAAAVVEKLISLGISPSRLSSKGFGESVPITSNNTPDGKAMNRRVEFIKQ